MRSIATSFLILLPSLGLVAQPAAGDRQTIKTSLAQGEVQIAFGAPAWNEAFKGQMKENFVWRLGNNDPTQLKTACALACQGDALPPGEYKLALRCKTPSEWTLLIYKGSDFYAEGLPTWELVQKSPVSDNAEVAARLGLSFDDNHTLRVHFGPYLATYALSPIALHPPVETAFARVQVKLQTMAIPVAEKPVSDVFVGIAVASMGQNSLTYDLRLSVDGEKASLKFVNTRTKAIEKEQAALKARVERIKARLEKASDEDKSRIQGMLTRIEGQIEALQKEADAAKRLQAEYSTTGEVKTREKPAHALEFSHERPQGGLILSFGAGPKDAIFHIEPREFLTQGR